MNISFFFFYFFYFFLVFFAIVNAEDDEDKTSAAEILDELKQLLVSGNGQHSEKNKNSPFISRYSTGTYCAYSFSYACSYRYGLGVGYSCRFNSDCARLTCLSSTLLFDKACDKKIGLKYRSNTYGYRKVYFKLNQKYPYEGAPAYILLKSLGSYKECPGYTIYQYQFETSSNGLLNNAYFPLEKSITCDLHAADDHEGKNDDDDDDEIDDSDKEKDDDEGNEGNPVDKNSNISSSIRRMGFWGFLGICSAVGFGLWIIYQLFFKYLTSSRQSPRSHGFTQYPGGNGPPALQYMQQHYSPLSNFNHHLQTQSTQGYGRLNGNNDGTFSTGGGAPTPPPQYSSFSRNLDPRDALNRASFAPSAQSTFAPSNAHTVVRPENSLNTQFNFPRSTVTSYGPYNQPPSYL